MIGCLDTYFAVLKYTKDHKTSALFNYILSRSEDGTGDWGNCILFEKDIINNCCLKELELQKLLNKLNKKYQLLNFTYNLAFAGESKIVFFINKNVYHNVIYGVI